MIPTFLPETFYTTPDLVAEAMSLPDPHDPLSVFKFSNISNPTYSYVCKLIKANEDQIDFRTNRCWRVHYIIDDRIPIAQYKGDEGSWRIDYLQYGGNKIPLHKNVLSWDPNPVYSFVRDSSGKIDLQTAVDEEGNAVYIKKRTGNKVYKNNGDPVIVKKNAYELVDNEYVLIENSYVFVEKYDDDDSETLYEHPKSAAIERMIYPGDSVKLRSIIGDGWKDMPDHESYAVFGGNVNNFEIDHNDGVLILRTAHPFNQFQEVKVCYRWGADPEITDVPYGIQRLCTLMTAKQVLSSQFWVVKVGGGGDIAGIKEQMMRMWDEEIAQLWSSFQAPSTVHSMIQR